MLAQLLRTLLGSEPCIRIKYSEKDRTELITALNEGNKDGLFSFQYSARDALIYTFGRQPRLPFSLQPQPTVEYDPYQFTKKLL